MRAGIDAMEVVDACEPGWSWIREVYMLLLCKGNPVLRELNLIP